MEQSLGCRVDGRVNGRVNGKVDGMVDGRVNGKVDGKVDGRVDGRSAWCWTMSPTNLLDYFQIASFYVHAHGIKNNSVLVGWQSKGNLRVGLGFRDDDD